jgi:conjugative transfer region protein TrbK
MDPKIIARATAVILLAGVLLACALELARQGRTLESSAPAVHDEMDLLGGELARCKAFGAEVAHDNACKAVWAQNRARFLAPSAPRQDRPIELFPAAPDVPKAVPKIHLDRAPSTPQSDVSTPSTGPEGR